MICLLSKASAKRIRNWIRMTVNNCVSIFILNRQYIYLFITFMCCNIFKIKLNRRQKNVDAMSPLIIFIINILFHFLFYFSYTNFLALVVHKSLSMPYYDAIYIYMKSAKCSFSLSFFFFNLSSVSHTHSTMYVFFSVLFCFSPWIGEISQQ